MIEKPGESPGNPEECAAAIKFSLWIAAPTRTTVDDDGNTALHGVAVWGSNDAVEMLVKAGANLDVKNKRGQTPWRIAEGAVFEDAVSAQPQTAALLRRSWKSAGSQVESPSHRRRTDSSAISFSSNSSNRPDCSDELRAKPLRAHEPMSGMAIVEQ